jgi:hypothetical protein
MILILKEGEFEKLPKPECYRYQNMLEFHNIPHDARFTFVKISGDHTEVTYDGRRGIQILSDRLIDINELRNQKIESIIGNV